MQSAIIWPEIRAHRFELTQLDDELLAVADLWSELAVRLSNYAPEFTARRQNVMRAIAERPLIG